MSKEPLTKSLYSSTLNTSTEASAGSGSFRERLPASRLEWRSLRSSWDLCGTNSEGTCMEGGREGGRE